MKNILGVLGCFLVLCSISSAKSGEDFKPRGNIDLEYRYYGETENKGYISDGWNDNNNYSRTQLQGKVELTKKYHLDFRVRNYSSLDHVNGESKKSNKTGSKDNRNESRMRFYTKHKKNLFSRFDYERTSTSEQRLAYNLFYEWKNDSGTFLQIGPRVKYNWKNSNDDKYWYSIGLYAKGTQKLPYGFKSEIEIDGIDYIKYGYTLENAYEKSYKPDELKVGIKAKILQETQLYQKESLDIKLKSEGGYDSYSFSNRELVSHNYIRGKRKDSEYSKYQAYISTHIRTDYKITKNTNLYVGLGAEYRNWKITAEENAKNWRWQPYIFTGIKTTF